MQNEDHSSASYHESVPAQGGQERSGANRADELGSDEVPSGSTDDYEESEDDESWEDNPAPVGPTEHARINMIWAEAYSGEGTPGAIGNNGGIPWTLPQDMRHFSALTVSHPVIMGRKTWESLPAEHRPLPDRDNIIVSYEDDYEAKGATVVDSIDEAISLACTQSIPEDGIDRSEIWIIGGSSIFRQCMKTADEAFVTQIDVNVDADTFAPDMESAVSNGSWKAAHVGIWRVPAADSGASKGIRRYRYVRFTRTKHRGWKLFHHGD